MKTNNPNFGIFDLTGSNVVYSKANYAKRYSRYVNKATQYNRLFFGELRSYSTEEVTIHRLLAKLHDYIDDYERCSEKEFNVKGREGYKQKILKNIGKQITKTKLSVLCHAPYSFRDDLHCAKQINYKGEVA